MPYYDNVPSGGDIPVSPSNPVHIPPPTASSLAAVILTVKSLEETARSSLAILQASYHTDEEISAHLNTLESTVDDVKACLRKDYARFSASVGFVRNAALPVIRLPPEVFSLIIAQVARIWSPDFDSDGLGWMKMTHVCTAWRRAVISHGFLWAREVGRFISPDSFHTILRRAQQAPLTVGNPWNSIGHDEEMEPLPDHYWPVLSYPSAIRNLNLTLTLEDVKRLADIMNTRTDFVLDNITIYIHEEDAYLQPLYATTAPIPSLREITFYNIFIPFQASGLVNLSIISWSGNMPLDVRSEHLLAALETCSNLISFRLNGWIPAAGRLWIVRLSSLHTLIIECFGNIELLIGLLEHLELPKLAYVCLEDIDNSTPVRASLTHTVVRALVLRSCVQPFISDVSRLSITASTNPRLLRYSCHVCFDDGRLPDMHPDMHSDFWLTKPGGVPDTRKGIHLQAVNMRASVEHEFDPAFLNTFLDNTIAQWCDQSSYSMHNFALQSVYLDSGATAPDWSLVLQRLVDIEVLYIPHFPNSATIDHGNSLFSVLSETNSDGAMLLPRLRTILCANTEILIQPTEPDARTDERAKTISAIGKLLNARAAHGKPLTCMKYGSTVEAKQASQSVRDADVFLNGMVSSYLHSNS